MHTLTVFHRQPSLILVSKHSSPLKMVCLQS